MITTQLKEIQEFVTAVNVSNSSNHKKEVIAQYKDNENIKSILVLVYSPYIQFNVTSANLKKNKTLVSDVVESSIFVLLSKLEDRTFTGHAAISACNAFIKAHSEFESLLYNIIDKDLQLRVGASLINKAIPDLIPEFDVQLANSYADYVEKLDFNANNYYVERKYDGVRVLALINGRGDVQFFSRQGNEFLTFAKIADDIKKLGLRNIVLDGEVCLVDSNGNEDFQSVMKEVRKKDHTVQNPKYIMFDLLTDKEFNDKKSDFVLVDRFQRLHLLDLSDCNTLSVSKQTKVKSREEAETLLDDAISKGWEGLILKRNAVYQGKRSNDILKMKKFYDAEYEVLDVEFGLIDDGSGKKVEGLTAISIEHKGNRVGVGSGFSYDQRIAFLKDPNKILNKIITVKYFEETKNQNGGISLRFPTLKIIHGDKREV